MAITRRSWTAILIAACLAGPGWAQMGEHHPPAQAAPAPPPAPHGGVPEADGGMMGGMMAGMHMCPESSMFVSGDSLYVMRGNELFRFDKDSLQLLASTMVPMTQVQGMQQTLGPTQSDMSSMQQMMREMMQARPQQFDRMFMQHMTRHHAGAITMSTLARYKADHPQLRQFARTVVDEQSRENRQFAVWLRQWYDASAVEAPMPMDQRTIERLQTLRGRDFEIEYTRAMIAHHAQGVQMARMAEQRAVHPELRAMASNIVADQTREIEQLRVWLSEWYGITA